MGLHKSTNIIGVVSISATFLIFVFLLIAIIDPELAKALLK